MKELIIQDGIHFVDLQRIYFARRGQAGTVPGFVSLAASRLRAVRYFWAGMMGRIGRIGRMVWGGCWVVSWETGKTRVFWRWGEKNKRRKR